MSTYVIGDVHNCYDELIELLHKEINIQPDDEVYFVGDLFDRGNKAGDVFYWLKRAVNNPQFHFTWGNHDYMMLQVLRRSGYHNITDCHMDDGWLYNGALNTIQSWEEQDVTPDEMDAVFEHYDDLLEFEHKVEVNDKLFHIVHAGLPEEHSWFPIDDYIWSRSDFYFNKWPEFEDNEFVIFGHTPTKFVWHEVDKNIEHRKDFYEEIGFPLRWKIDEERDRHVLEFNHRIMIDTGCVYHGWLTAYRLEDGKVFQVKSKQ